MATTAVVPLPINGSNATSPTLEDESIGLCSNPSGYTAKCAHAHIAKCGIGKPHANNNRIERLNGTLRERVKRRRDWKSIETPIAEGQRINYNFVKPHATLDGQAPAKEAGIDIADGKDKWLELFRRA